KTIFTKLYLDADEHGTITVTTTDLADPFNTITTTATEHDAHTSTPDHTHPRDTTDLATRLAPWQPPDESRGGTLLTECTAPNLSMIISRPTLATSASGSNKPCLVGVAGFEPTASSSRSNPGAAVTGGPARHRPAEMSLGVRVSSPSCVVVVTQFVTHNPCEWITAPQVNRSERSPATTGDRGRMPPELPPEPLGRRCSPGGHPRGRADEELRTTIDGQQCLHEHFARCTSVVQKGVYCRVTLVWAPSATTTPSPGCQPSGDAVAQELHVDVVAR
ncbi:MAG: hypothetical protein ACRDRQ_17900, partial [Pseudonocardiaceae bacterium]